MKLWNDGLSASQVAAELGGTTRNAVIAKLHRMGASERGKSASAPAQRAPRKPREPKQAAQPRATVGNLAIAFAPPQEIAVVEEEPEEVVIPFSERVTLMQLRETHCRWPMGDPKTEDFRFCGRAAPAGKPYCAHHARIAYVPIANLRRPKEKRAGASNVA